MLPARAAALAALLASLALAGCLGGGGPSALDPVEGPRVPPALSVLRTTTFEAELAGSVGAAGIAGVSGARGALDVPGGAALAVVEVSWPAAPGLAAAVLSLCRGSCEGRHVIAEARGAGPLRLEVGIPPDRDLGWELAAEDGVAARVTLQGEVTYLAGDLGVPPDPPLPVLRHRGDGTPLPLEEGDRAAAVRYALTGSGRGEPNLGVTRSGAVFVSADDFVLRSTDGARTFDRVWTLPTHPVLGNADPMLWVDPWTDRVYADPMVPALACSWLAWSDDDGATWTERPGVCHPPPMDHQKLGGGPPGPDAPPLAGLLHPSVLYQCYNQVLSTICAASYDGGLDWAHHAVVSDAIAGGCGGVNGNPAVGPDGVAYVPFGLRCDAPHVGVSRDGGLTWTVSRVAGGGRPGDLDPDMAVGLDNTAYLVWIGPDTLPRLARTRDHGATWEGPWTVSPPGVQAAVFPAVAVDRERNTLAVAFLGTDDPGAGSPTEAPPTTRWHLWTVTSLDPLAAEPAFVARRVTPDSDPVQLGCIWLEGFPSGPCRNLLDFIDGAIGPDGAFYVAYTEGCVEGCAGNPRADADESRASEVAVAVVEGWATAAPARDARELP